MPPDTAGKMPAATNWGQCADAPAKWPDYVAEQKNVAAGIVWRWTQTCGGNSFSM
jgi:hypothetical protein